MRSKIKEATKWIAFGDLNVDPIYQRDVVQARVDKLVRTWRDSDVGVITVSTRDGRLWIVDGQHRYLAALELGKASELVLCRVHEGLSVEQEAELFASLNDQRAPTAYDRFKAGLVYGDRIAVGVEKATQHYGFVVASSNAKGKISCVAKLMELQRREPEVLDATLEVISNAWGDERAAVEAPIVGGVAEVLWRFNGSVDRGSLSEKLRKQTDPGALLGHAKSMKAISGGNVTKAVATAVLEIYNKGRRSKALH
jgi:hypothetical protein